LTLVVSSLATPKADQLMNLADQAISPDQSVAQSAQNELRAAGPEGLQALEQRFATEISAHRKGAPSGPRWKLIGAALDRVGGQYDNYASGLYWYTDLEKAKAAAQASGKPILSLRLLGRLDEDLSCANSRFFRTTLYPSAEINQMLKERFVLHWESVRPAPRVTIDFGDGRKLQRTITGNSIHYVLDPDGNVADVLPGLYSAAVFRTELKSAADTVAEARNKGVHDYGQHFKLTEARLLSAWASDLGKIQVAVPQAVGESTLEQLMSDQKWQQVAQLHMEETAFDPQVREVMTKKFPTARKATPMAVSKSAVETPMVRALYNLQANVALDTVRDNYMLRSKILEFLSSNGRTWSLSALNSWVYDKIFLTPRQDPWLGLAPPDVFSAIDGNGQGIGNPRQAGAGRQ
jgi:hypothetical protein